MLKRSIAVLTVVVAVLGAAGAAFAAPLGPSQSNWVDGEITCGHEDTFLDEPVVVYNGRRGVEVCVEKGPLESRVFLRSNEQGPIYLIDYAQIDTGNDNVLGADQHQIDLPF